MKKYLLFAVFAIWSFKLAAVPVGLYDYSAENGMINAEWSPFQLSLAPMKYGQLMTSKTRIYGLGIGLFVLDQEAAAVSAGLTSCLCRNYGLQCAVVTMTAFNYGLDIGPFICFTDRNYGVQISLMNVETYGNGRREEHQGGAPGLQIGGFNVGQGFQIGIVNYNTDAYIPVLPLFNFSK